MGFVFRWISLVFVIPEPHHALSKYLCTCLLSDSTCHDVFPVMAQVCVLISQSDHNFHDRLSLSRPCPCMHLVLVMFWKPGSWAQSSFNFHGVSQPVSIGLPLLSCYVTIVHFYFKLQENLLKSTSHDIPDVVLNNAY